MSLHFSSGLLGAAIVLADPLASDLDVKSLIIKFVLGISIGATVAHAPRIVELGRGLVVKALKQFPFPRKKKRNRKR